ncbi:MAG: nitroreductase family protein [Coriobacteriales bacterium]|jgi:nitroreductase
MDEIFKRSSIRKYTDEPVSDEDIEKLMRAAMAAPSAANQQPWEFFITRDEKMKKKLADSSPFTSPTASASCAIVPCIRAEGLKVPAMVPQDMGACVENILLEATSLGLGAVWQGVYPDRERAETISRLMGIEDGLVPFCIIAVGHPAGEPNITGPSRYDEKRVHWV